MLNVTGGQVGGPVRGEWRLLRERLNEGRYNHGAAVAGGYLWVVGGLGAGGYLDSVERLSLPLLAAFLATQGAGEEPLWESMPSRLVAKRLKPAVATFGCSLFVVGSYHQGSVEYLDLRRPYGAWQLLRDTANAAIFTVEARYSAGVATAGGRLVLAGGSVLLDGGRVEAVASMESAVMAVDGTLRFDVATPRTHGLTRRMTHSTRSRTHTTTHPVTKCCLV
jgi:hypothetical protein